MAEPESPSLKGPMKFLSCCAACTMVLGLVAGTAWPQPQQRFEAAVDALHIYVFLGGSGERDWSLSAEDFVVALDGQGKRVTDLQLIDAANGQVALLNEVPGEQPRFGVTAFHDAMSPLVTARRFLIFLDLHRMTRPGLRNARRAAGEFVEDRVLPTDFVGLTVYDPWRGLRHVVPMSTHRAPLVEALGLLEGALPAGGDAPDLAGVPLEDFAQLVSREEGEGPGSAAAEDLLREIEEARVEVEATAKIAALRETFADLQGVGGPTHLLLFSRGVPDAVFADADGRREIELAVAEAGAAGVIVHAFQPDNLPASNVHDPAQIGSSWQPGYDPGLGGEPPWFVMRERAVLYFLATETGGGAAFYRQALSKGLSAAEEWSRRYYLLTVQLAGDEPAGAKIEVRARRPDTHLEWEPRSFRVTVHAELSPAARGMRAVEALDIRSVASELPVEYVAVPFPAPGGAKLRVWMEIGGARVRELGATAAPGQLGFQLLGMVVTRAGNVVDHFRKRARLTVDGGDGGDQANLTLRYFDELDLGFGEYFVKLLVRESATGSMFSRSLRVLVPEDARTLSMSGPLITTRLEEPPAVASTADAPVVSRGALSVDGQLVVPILRPVCRPGDEIEVLVQANGIAHDGGLMTLTWAWLSSWCRRDHPGSLCGRRSCVESRYRMTWSGSCFPWSYPRESPGAITPWLSTCRTSLQAQRSRERPRWPWVSELTRVPA